VLVRGKPDDWIVYATDQNTFDPDVAARLKVAAPKGLKKPTVVEAAVEPPDPLASGEYAQLRPWSFQI